MASFEKFDSDLQIESRSGFRVRIVVCLRGLQVRIRKLINKFLRKEEV